MCPRSLQPVLFAALCAVVGVATGSACDTDPVSMRVLDQELRESRAKSADPAPVVLAVIDYLTARITPTYRMVGEKLIAFHSLPRLPRVRVDVELAGAVVRGQVRVYVRSPAGVDQIRVEPLVCGLNNFRASWRTYSCKVGTTRFGPPSQDTPPDDIGSDWVNVAACDYFLQLWRCYVTKLPESHRPGATSIYRALLKRLRREARDRARFVELNRACFREMESLRKELIPKPRFKGCR